MRSLSEEQVGLVAGRARALGEPARVRIVEALSRRDQAVGQLAALLGMQHSTASKHLQVLFRAGLVRRRRAASTVIYSIADAGLAGWFRYLSNRQLGTAAIKKAESSRV
jgi:DNA-binding transcriptional ArsR family regulator